MGIWVQTDAASESAIVIPYRNNFIPLHCVHQMHCCNSDTKLFITTKPLIPVKQACAATPPTLALERVTSGFSQQHRYVVAATEQMLLQSSTCWPDTGVNHSLLLQPVVSYITNEPEPQQNPCRRTLATRADCLLLCYQYYPMPQCSALNLMITVIAIGTYLTEAAWAAQIRTRWPRQPDAENKISFSLLYLAWVQVCWG